MASLEEYAKAYQEFDKAEHKLTMDFRNVFGEAFNGADRYPDGMGIRVQGVVFGNGTREVIDGSKWPNANELGTAIKEYQTTKLKVIELFKQLNASDRAGAKEPPRVVTIRPIA